MRFSPGDLPRITADDLVPREARDRRRRSLVLEAPPGHRQILTTEYVRLSFGWRLYVRCPGCDRRVRFLYLVETSLHCGRCLHLCYRGRLFSGTRHYQQWGRWLDKLHGVRKELGKRGLRLAKRGRLERLEADLLEKIRAGLREEIDLMGDPPTEPARTT